MELAIFPLAAVLLLLSGLSAPAHALAQQLPSAALIRQFFDTDACSATKGLTGPRATRRAHTPAHATALRNIAAALRSPACAHRLSSTHLRARSFDRKQYSTRFGFAEGAYLALGPPVLS